MISNLGEEDTNIPSIERGKICVKGKPVIFEVTHISHSPYAMITIDTVKVCVKFSPTQSIPKPFTRHLSDLVYHDSIKNQINKFVIIPVEHPNLLTKLGMNKSNGVIIAGKKNTGKTAIISSILRDSSAQCFYIDAKLLFTIELTKSIQYVQKIQIDGGEAKWPTN